MRSLAEPVGGLLLATLSLGMLIGPLGQPAEAHADLADSDPAEDEPLEEAPHAVELYFTEPVELPDGSVQVIKADGAEVEAGQPKLGDGGTTVRVALDHGTGAEAQGTYTVRWHVLGQDSHNIDGSFLFHVGGETQPVELPEEDDRSVEIAGYAGRWLAFAGTVTALGAAGLALAVPSERAVRARLRWFVVAGGFAGAAGVAVVLVTQIAETSRVGWFDAAGEVPDAFGSRVEDLLAARFLMLAVVAFLAAVLWRLRWAPLPVLGCGGASLVLASFTSHAWTSEQRDLAVVSDTVHFAAVSIWIGGLLALLVSLRVATDATRLAHRFSAMALGAVVAVVPTGITLAWQHLGSFDNIIETRYGQILLAKVLLFGMLMVIGYMNKTRLVGLAERSILPLSRSLRVEVFVAVGVLAITSALVHQAPGRNEVPRDGGSSGESFSQLLPADESRAEGSGKWWTVAYAHGSEADIHVREEHLGEGSVHYVVHAQWDDGDVIEDGTLNAAATSPSGERHTPVALESTGGGLYEGPVEMPEPGEWTVQFTFLHPDDADGATDTATFEMGARPAPSEPAEPEPTPGTGPEATDIEEADEAADLEEAQAEDEADEIGVSLILVAAVFLVVGAVVGAVFWAAVGGRKSDEDGEGQTAAGPTEPEPARI